MAAQMARSSMKTPNDGAGIDGVAMPANRSSTNSRATMKKPQTAFGAVSPAFPSASINTLAHMGVSAVNLDVESLRNIVSTLPGFVAFKDGSARFDGGFSKFE